MRETLRSVSDAQVLTNTDAIISQDRKLTLRLLVHLHEIERRKLYLKRGYGSMFQYCTMHLRLSEPAAVRRIRTARCLAHFPELYDLLACGEVNLTTVSLVARILRPGNKDTLLARMRGKSKRDVQAIVAEYEPRAALPPDRLRTIVVPVVTATAPHLFVATQTSTVSGDGKKSSAREPVQTVDCAAPASEGPQAATFERRALVEFTAREIVMEKLGQVRSIASHRLPVTQPLSRSLSSWRTCFRLITSSR